MKIIIAGAGAVGTHLAKLLSGEKQDIILMDEDESRLNALGGNLDPAGAAPFKREYRELAECLARRCQRQGVKIMLNTEATPEMVRDMDPDALFVAIGSTELRPPIPGLDSDKVVMAIDAELHPEKLGDTIVVMGGGLVGVEGAVNWGMEGHKVTVVEMRSTLAPDSNHFYRDGLLVRAYENAQIMVDTTVKAVTKEGVLVEHKDGTQETLPCDTVVCALGFRPDYKKVDALADIVDECYIIGDCAKVGKVLDATSTAYYAALRV